MASRWFSKTISKRNIQALADRSSRKYSQAPQALPVPLRKDAQQKDMQGLKSRSEVRAEGNELENMIEILRNKTTAWGAIERAQFDFRSDVVTTPTLSMLRAIVEATLLDDVYGEDTTTISLESHMAAMAGHETGLFVLSGTMANQIALRSHLYQPPHAILCDARAHIIHWEAGGIASMSGAMIQPVAPSNGEFLTLEDIQSRAILTEDIHRCPTRVISLENTISGIIYPLSEVQRISKWARQHGIALHLDGARLWEAVASGSGSVKDYAECFDSVYLDFSKGLGAPLGAVVVGSSQFIKQARRVRKSIGGGFRQAGVISAPARRAVDDMFGSHLSSDMRGSKMRAVHELAKEVAHIWVAHGGKLLKKTETNIVWLDLRSRSISVDELKAVGRNNGIELDGCRVVLHYQISKESIKRLKRVFDEVLNKPAVILREIKSC